MLAPDYHWQRPQQRKRSDSSLGFWIMIALGLSVAAHAVLFFMFDTFKVRQPEKILLTESFRVTRSTIDASVMDTLADPGNEAQSPTDTADGTPDASNDTQQNVEEAIAEFARVADEDLAGFIANTEVRLTPSVEDTTNMAVFDPNGSSGGLTDDLAENDSPDNDVSSILKGLESKTRPLDPNHPAIAAGDLLGGLEAMGDSELTPGDPNSAAGGGDLIPDGYASLDDVLGMKGNGDPGKPIWVPTDVLFEFNSAELRDDARLSLMKLGALIMQRKDSEFFLEGHTDLIGDGVYNMILSENRATAIRNWLLQALQLDPERLHVRGYGKTKPLVLDGTAEEQARNRRVEVTIKKIER